MTRNEIVEFFDRARRERRIFEDVPVVALALRRRDPDADRFSPVGNVAGVKVKIAGEEVFVPRRQLMHYLPDDYDGSPRAGVPEALTKIDVIIHKVSDDGRRLSLVASECDAIRQRKEQFFEGAAIGKKYEATVTGIRDMSVVGRSSRYVQLVVNKVELEMPESELSDNPAEVAKLSTPGTKLEVITLSVGRKSAGHHIELSAKRRLLVPYGQPHTGTIISDTHDCRPVAYRFGDKHEKRDRLVEITDGTVTVHVHVPFDKCGNHYFSRKGSEAQVVDVNPLGEHLIGRILFKTS